MIDPITSQNPQVLVVSLNTCIDKTLTVSSVRANTLNRAASVRDIPGGKGVNVARALQRLGVHATCLVIVGGETGNEIVNLLDLEGIPHVPVFIRANSRLSISVYNQTSRNRWTYVEPGPEVTKSERTTILGIFNDLVESAEFVVLSGSVPCVSLSDIYREMVEEVQRKGKYAVVDTRDKALSLSLDSQPFLVKSNLEEAGHILGRNVGSPSDKKSLLDIMRVYRDSGVAIPIISYGRKGAMFGTPDGNVLLATPPKVKEINGLGSGDSMVAGIVMGLVQRKSPLEAITIGIAAGAANAMVWDPGDIDYITTFRLLDEVRIRNALS